MVKILSISRQSKTGVCNLARVAIRRQRADRKHSAKVSILQNLSHLWKNWLHTAERVIRNQKLRNIHAAMNRQITVAPLGHAGKNCPLAVLCAVVLNKNHRELLVM